MRWPRLVLDDALVTVGCDKPLESAMKHALGDMILWLEEDYGLTRAEAYMLLTHVADARACQVSVAAVLSRRLKSAWRSSCSSASTVNCSPEMCRGILFSSRS